MFSGLTAAQFDSPDFREDSVREFVIAPILRRLGYGPTGDVRSALSIRLKHPFITVGTRRIPVTLVPDYTLYSGDKPIFVLDAKAPHEDVGAGKHVEQAYSYASHPEIRCREFGLCNGRRLVMFGVESPKPLLDLRFEEFEPKWNTIEKHLSPQFLMQPELRRYNPDLGTRLKRIGMGRDHELVMLGLRLDLFGKVDEKLFTAATNADFDGSGPHCASFDFRRSVFEKIVAGLPLQLKQQFCRALARQPFKACAEGCIEIDAAMRLGKETQGEDERFVPLVIHKVLKSRFNPSEGPPALDEPPAGVFRLRSVFSVAEPASE